MAIKASALITLSSVTDVSSVTRYYLLQSSTLSRPSKPTTKLPSGNWTDTEPTYTAGSTNSLYFTDLTVFSDGTWSYSSVSLSSSYEAAKAAYNKATSAQSTATTAQASIDGLQIGGRNLFTGTKDFSGSDWIDWRIEAWTRTSTPYNGFTVMEYQGTWNGLSQHITAAANEWFVLSAYIKRDSAATVLFYCEESNRNGTNLTSSVGTDWTRLQMVFQVTTAGTITPRFENSVTGKKLTVCGLKLERGTRATDWTPAPEDADSAISEAQSIARQALSNSEIIVGTQTAATGSWTGVASFASLTDGQQIVYWLPYAGSGNATLNLTLSGGGTTGAKNVYYSGSTRVTTHYAAGNVIHLTYRVNANVNGTNYTGWWADANYDSNTYDRIRLNNAITAKSAITEAHLIVGDGSGYYHLGASVTFDVNKPILYAASAIAAAATGSSNYLSYPSINLRTTIENSSWTATAKQTVYLAGTLSGTTFTTLAADYITTNATASDVVYISLGYMVNTYQMYLYPEHPMYMYINGTLRSL